VRLLDDTIASTPIARQIPTDDEPQGLCLDRGYDYDSTRESVIAQRFEPHIRARGEDTRNQLRDPDWKPRRWVVEACHSWINRNRSLLIRWSKKDENHLALLQLASGLIAFKKAHAAAIGAAY
jgi:putative transposase